MLTLKEVKAKANKRYQKEIDEWSNRIDKDLVNYYVPGKAVTKFIVSSNMPRYLAEPLCELYKKNGWVDVHIEYEAGIPYWHFIELNMSNVHLYCED